MNILFDLLATQPEKKLKYHGGSEYAKVVFWALVKKSPCQLFCIYDPERFLDEDIKLYCLENNLALINIRNFPDLNSIIEKYSIQRFYSALPLEKKIQGMLPFNNNVRSIITIHGLRSLELPYDKYEIKYLNGFKNKLKFFYKKFLRLKYEKSLLNKIKLLIKNYYKPTIITVSDYSRSSLKTFIPEFPENDIHVLYSPISDYFQESNDESIITASKLESGKYFLLLSAGIWQKNSYRTLMVFNSLLKEDQLKGYKLVIIGASGAFKKSFIHSSFIFLDYQDRPKLEILLKNAHALVYPTLNEGFGYPPLEAFKYGTGVIASAIGPVMEVCGNAALFFNPCSLTEIKLRILQSINDPDFITNTQARIDQFLQIRQRQIKDLNTLVDIICD